MNKTTKQLMMTVAGTALTWTAVSVNVPTEAAQFNVVFSDNLGQQVGSGSFKYSDTGTSCVKLVDSQSSCNPEFGYPDSLFVTHLLSNEYSFYFPFNILGETWYFEGHNTWWSDISQLPGQVILDRSGQGTIFENKWSIGFGDLRISEGGRLTMNFNSTSNTSGSGSWTALIEDNPASNTFSGTWTATAVPEPLTILGSLTALGLGASIKRKLARKTYP